LYFFIKLIKIYFLLCINSTTYVKYIFNEANQHTV